MKPTIAQNATLIFPLQFKLMISQVKPPFIIVTQIVHIITISTKTMYINAPKDQNVLRNMVGWYLGVDNA